MRANEVNNIFKEFQEEMKSYNLAYEQKQKKNLHLIRAVFIIIDLTQSMKITDFKPSRLTVSLQMVKNFIKKSRDLTPIIKFSIGVVYQQKCKPLCKFLYRQKELTEKYVDQIKVQPDSGFFSLENSLSIAMDMFKTLPKYFHKQVFMIQSSPSTKDDRDIFQTIKVFEKSSITINIASLVGETFIFKVFMEILKKLTEKCQGRYQTISSVEKFGVFIDEISRPPEYNENSVGFQFIDLSFCNKKCCEQPVRCYCCFKRMKQKSYHSCGKCKAILCRKPPMECPICMTILVDPQDLFRHKSIQHF